MFQFLVMPSKLCPNVVACTAQDFMGPKSGETRQFWWGVLCGAVSSSNFQKSKIAQSNGWSSMLTDGWGLDTSLALVSWARTQTFKRSSQLPPDGKTQGMRWTYWPALGSRPTSFHRGVIPPCSLVQEIMSFQIPGEGTETLLLSGKTVKQLWQLFLNNHTTQWVKGRITKSRST